MALLQTVVLFCPSSCPTKGGFYGFNEAGLGDVLHVRTKCSDERVSRSFRVHLILMELMEVEGLILTLGGL